MNRDGTVAAPQVLVPGVVSLAASSRRTLKHGDSFAMFDEFGDVVEVEHSPAGLFHFDTRFLSRLFFTLEGHRPLILSSTVQPDNLTLDVDLTNPDMFQDDRLVLAKDTFHVARAKFLWQASCHELFTITNYADERMRVRFALEFAAEHGREPRYAGVRIGAERRLGLEHLEIGARARQNAVDGDV